MRYINIFLPVFIKLAQTIPMPVSEVDDPSGNVSPASHISILKDNTSIASGQPDSLSIPEAANFSPAEADLPPEQIDPNLKSQGTKIAELTDPPVGKFYPAPKALNCAGDKTSGSELYCGFQHDYYWVCDKGDPHGCYFAGSSKVDGKLCATIHNRQVCVFYTDPGMRLPIVDEDDKIWKSPWEINVYSRRGGRSSLGTFMCSVNLKHNVC